MNNDKLREEAAAIAHGLWAHWMRHYFTLNNPMEYHDQWKRLMDTPYKALAEHEKESDRKVSNAILSLILRESKAAAERVVEAVVVAPLKRIDEQRERVKKTDFYEARNNMDYYLGGMTEVRDLTERAARQAADNPEQL